MSLEARKNYMFVLACTKKVLFLFRSIIRGSHSDDYKILLPFENRQRLDTKSKKKLDYYP